MNIVYCIHFERAEQLMFLSTGALLHFAAICCLCFWVVMFTVLRLHFVGFIETKQKHFLDARTSLVLIAAYVFLFGKHHLERHYIVICSEDASMRRDAETV